MPKWEFAEVNYRFSDPFDRLKLIRAEGLQLLLKNISKFCHF